jgi:YggT family protein
VNVAGQLIEGLLFCFIALLWIRLIVEWVQVFARSWRPQGAVLLLLEGVFSVTDPPVRSVRRIVPPLRLGGVAIDLSLMLVLIGAYVLKAVAASIFL